MVSLGDRFRTVGYGRIPDSFCDVEIGPPGHEEMTTMGNERLGNHDEPRKAYSRPIVREVKLRPEEAVLGNCKISGSGGPGQTSCDSPVACTTLGS